MSAFLSDNFVSLRTVEETDLPKLAAWRNDPDLRLRTREFRPLTMADQRWWWEQISGPDRRDFMFVLVAHDRVIPSSDELGSRAIGVVGLCHWSPRDRTAEVSFYIGDTAVRGHGYMKRALVLLHRFGFSELGLDRIWAEAYAFNDASIGLLEGLGYRREGILREHVFRHGGRVDSIMLGLLKREHEALVRPQNDEAAAS